VVGAVPARVLREVSVDEILSLEAGCAAHLFPSSTQAPGISGKKPAYTSLFSYSNVSNVACIGLTEIFPHREVVV